MLRLKNIGSSYGLVLLPHLYGKLKAFKAYLNYSVFY